MSERENAYFGDLRLFLPKCEKTAEKMLAILQTNYPSFDENSNASVLMWCNRLSDKGNPNIIFFGFGGRVATLKESLEEMKSCMERENSSAKMGLGGTVGIMIELSKWKSDCGNLKIGIVVTGLNSNANLAIAMRILAIQSECPNMAIFYHVKKAGLELSHDFLNNNHYLHELLNA